MADPSPTPLWTPSPDRIERAAITAFARAQGLSGDYGELWRWSVADIARFWESIWSYFEVDGSHDRVLDSPEMPGTEWFPGATVSYAAHIFRDRDDSEVAIRHASELRELGELTWGELRGQTARIRAGLLELGVGRGDRVVAYLPNIPETIAAFLACASLGVIWSSAAPEFGARSVIDRFAQIGPKLMLTIDGYRYGGKDHDRSEIAAEIAAEIPSLERVVRLGYLDGSGWEPGFLGPEDAELEFEELPFGHPLWILYSSGTTGPAEGDRPLAGRDPARAPEEDASAPRRAGGRPRLLVHDDRLDDVELPARGTADQGLGRAVRRQPRPPQPRPPLGPRG